MTDGASSGIHTIRPYDAEGDDDIDFITCEFDNAQYSWLNQDDGNGWQIEHLPTCPARAGLFPGDIDGDGVPDLVSKNLNQIVWWKLSAEGVINAGLQSIVLDTELEPYWRAVEWSAQTPADSSVSVHLRGGDDYHDDEMGDWLEVAASGDELSSYIADGSRYFQHMILPTASSDGQTPVFEEITVHWDDTVGVDGVELSVGPADDGVLVGWTTAEDAPASLRVQRGADNPAGVSGALDGRTTRWLDRNVTPGESYVYWLEMTADDGHVQRFGPTEAVVVPEEAQRLSLDEPWPSPASDTLTLSYSLPESCVSAALTVYDLSGRSISTQALDPTPGRNSLTLPTETYHPSVYIARIAGDGASVSRRFVISR